MRLLWGFRHIVSIVSTKSSESDVRSRQPGSGALARRVLGVLLLAMAIGQLADVGGFVEVIDTYGVGGKGAAATIGVALLVGELLAGVGLLGGTLGRWKGASRLAVLVAVAWSALGAQAFARGLVVPNCGCFGIHLAQPLRWWVLVQDLEFMALAWWTLRTTTRWPVPIDESEPDSSRTVETRA